MQALRKMKRNALLTNTARGGLVDESALLQALEGGLIAGAGVDVLTAEPPRDGIHCSRRGARLLGVRLHGGKPRHLVT